MLLFSPRFNIFCVMLLIFNFASIIAFNKKNNECLFHHRRKEDIKGSNTRGNDTEKLDSQSAKCLRQIGFLNWYNIYEPPGRVLMFKKRVHLTSQVTIINLTFEFLILENIKQAIQ